jgi:cytochrome P450
MASLATGICPFAPDHVPPELVVDAPIAGQAPGSDPYLQLAALHDGPRAIFKAPSPDQPNGAWVISRAEDVRFVLQNAALFSSREIAPFARYVGETWPTIPIELDPPEHMKFRLPLNPIFSPNRMKQMEAGVRARAVALIEAFAGAGRCEFVAAFANPFPISIFMQIMGLPEEDFDDLVRWEHELLHARDDAERQRGATSFLRYLRALIADRKADPRDDLASQIAHAEIAGRPITEDEVIGIFFLLVAAGLDTVAASLGLYFRHLALDQALQARLRADPALIPDAVEEFLRRYTISTTSRTVTADTEVAGVQMKAGDKVIVPTGAPSFDAAEFVCPMDFDIARTPNRHFAFSYGPHRCIGSHLARRELVIAMEECLARLPPFRIAEGKTSTIVPGTLLGVDKLPLAWA